MFEHWNEFYLLIGSAAGALIGLLFVVETLTSRYNLETATRAASVYTSPLVFHFAIVLALSGVAMVPAIEGRTAGLFMAAGAAAGFGAAGRVIYHLGPGSMIKAAHWSDIWGYGVGPLISYSLLAAAAYNVWNSGQHAAPLLAAALVALLLLTIRNAWDLVTWMAPRAEKPEMVETSRPQ